jgi:hypothetical protein
VRLSLPRRRLGPRAALVSKVAATIRARVTVDQLSVIARPRDPDQRSSQKSALSSRKFATSLRP